MTFRTLTIALLALAFLGSSIIGIQLLAHGANQTAESIEVAVATQALERGTTIQPEMVELKSWPQDLMLDGMLTSVSELADRVVLTSVVAGEPLLDDKLALPGVGQTIASLIPQGMRAITIPTPTVSSSVAGFVLPCRCTADSEPDRRPELRRHLNCDRCSECGDPGGQPEDPDPTRKSCQPE